MQKEKKKMPTRNARIHYINKLCYIMSYIYDITIYISYIKFFKLLF